MGCDIHLYKEKKIGGKWVTADEWTPYDYGDDDKGVEVDWGKRFTGRNYQLFGLLSKGVRCDHEYSFMPRGIPHDACGEILGVAKSWDSDGHSHSFLYLSELKDMLTYLDGAKMEISGMKDADELALLQASIDSGNPDWDLLFPYCRSTNAPGAVEFSIDVPASFYVGDDLKTIISGFDGIDGENHRIVFFFDN